MIPMIYSSVRFGPTKRETWALAWRVAGMGDLSKPGRSPRHPQLLDLTCEMIPGAMS
jgi:hypothetical protein